MSLKKKANSADNFRKKIDNIEQQLSEENERIYKISSVQESLTHLKRSMDGCIGLLSNSLDAGEVKSSFEHLAADNEREFTKTYRGFEEKAEILRRRIIDLRNERDAIIQEYENSADRDNEIDKD